MRAAPPPSPRAGVCECECAICLDPAGAQAAHTTACGHTFHARCLRQWVGHGGTRCPLCNASLPPGCAGATPAVPPPVPPPVPAARVRGAARAWITPRRCALTSALVVVFLLVPLLLFYALLYVGKVLLWAMLLGRPHSAAAAGGGNATAGGNATRAQEGAYWAPSSVHFLEIFVGVAGVLIGAVMTLLCRVFVIDSAGVFR